MQTHFPGYVKDYESLSAKGIDVVACIAVNDAFVMAAWGENQNAAGKIRMLADTTGEFTKVLLLTDPPDNGHKFQWDLLSIMERLSSIGGKNIQH